MSHVGIKLIIDMFPIDNINNIKLQSHIIKILLKDKERLI